ncbi:hypothetical protein GGI25_005181 [Coemansia spiralis]|uniref:Histone-lysine N-methyltransferase n=2 Tax=Coemansia TaxID=4863 RepID=A0A9W8KVX9_9FUNG|nr:hypothetical protein EDC05_002929 [Coemansia umbellata]KAJ2623375.1 hypothetical protein GGI26_002413 [Coemansia sp. RSA 1358]KAJ2672254.1 hypothetical protein GGI25_005181 [Coemansia spiralis]
MKTSTKPPKPEEEESYEVEKIVDDRWADGVHYYLLKWKGYDASENTWEPEGNLQCPSIVARYRASKVRDAEAKQYARGIDVSGIWNCPSIHKLRVVNTVDSARLPDDFTYIDGYVCTAQVPQPSTVMFPCSCTDGCGADCACMQVPYYDADGLLCIDHSQCIIECGDACACSRDCPNRVVQRGNIIEMDIRRMVAKGWGVVSRKRIRRGEYICRYTGELMSDQEASALKKTHSTYLFDLDKECPAGRSAHFTIDAQFYGNVSHFFNHSCEPNMSIWGVYINHLDPRLHELAFFANRDIAPDEELTFDYCPNMQHARSSRSVQLGACFKCNCGSASCRGSVFA